MKLTMFLRDQCCKPFVTTVAAEPIPSQEEYINGDKVPLSLHFTYSLMTQHTYIIFLSSNYWFSIL